MDVVGVAVQPERLKVIHLDNVQKAHRAIIRKHVNDLSARNLREWAYTEKFAMCRTEFRQRTGLNVSERDYWRLVLVTWDQMHVPRVRKR